ncbi:cadherin domain-containing protein [Sulfurimonas sp.]|uniref:cadherin domain-containing protein n=1 Tax=Sulfurimonas sp. TaxID=2022749 RepID=UPI002B487886|nr:cadherin domain-containing protein [Sulfurimonas sp.]
MKKLIILILLFTLSLFAEPTNEPINEYKSDIYFANGVGATSREKSYMQGEVVYDNYIDNDLQIEDFVGKYDLAFNTGRGPISDYSEAWFQYLDENAIYNVGWNAFTEAISRATGPIIGGALKLTEETIKHLEQNDINTQVEAYRQSIYNGHKVIVIAHSQGNFFTNKAYKTFNIKTDKWIQNYFVTIGLASPSDIKINNSSYLTYDNDPISILNGAGTVMDNPMRYYTWYAGPNVPVDSTTTSPCVGTEVAVGKTPYCNDADWIAKEKSSYRKYHEFKYYMSTPITRDKVYSFITNAINSHKTAKSQWKFKKQSQCGISGCEDKLREVEHEYDSVNLKIDDKVYPFKEEGKLYKVQDSYVKASYGGKSIAEPLTEGICYELKDKNNTSIETIDSNFEGNPKIPKNGYIEVTLAWNDKTIDMDLSVALPNGTHDIKNISCQPLEHFFAVDDTGLTPGVYPVHVTYKNDANIVKEVREYPNIIVSIKTPGGSEIRNVSFNVIDSLANGHIADIVVEENKIRYVPTDRFKQQATVIYNSYNRGNNSSVGGSSNGGSSDGSYNGGNEHSASWTPPIPHFNNVKDYIYYILWHISKADLGALAGADVSIYKATDFDADSDTGVNPIWQSQTTYGSTVHTAGIIAWDRNIINTLDNDKVYVIKVDGGTDIDVNDDTVVDSTPTINLGTIHALATGYELKNIGLKVNIITELAYQISKDRLHSDTSTVMQRSDEASKCLIKKDFNMDGKVNHIDGLLWMPYKDKNTVIRDYNSNFTPIISKIHNAQPIYEEAYNLFAKPMIEGFNATIREDSKAGAIVGQIKSYCTSESPISEYTISGTGAQNFEVDSKGTMRVSSLASFVYENKQIYDLHVSGKNAFGSTQSVQVYIEIAADGSPILGGSVSTFVIEKMSAGTIRGSISIDNRGSPITKVKLVGNGAKNFDISLKGSISVASNATIDKSNGTYYLKAIATNAIGDSAPISVTFKIYDDLPVLSGLISKIYKNTPTGTSIGKLGYYQGLSSITSFGLTGIGSENFDISSIGVITIAEAAKISLKNAPYYLQATATNSSGTSSAVAVTIRVVEPPASPSEGIHVSNFSNSLYFSVANGKSVGKIGYRYNLNPPNSFKLEGEQSTPFSIDNSGNMIVSDASLLRDKIGNTFVFKVIASNDYISGSEATVRISIIDDVPSISNFSTSIMEGTYTNAIGKVGYSYGMNPIKSFSLSGDGASDFTISNSGYIYVADGVSLTYSRQSSYALTVTGVNTIQRRSSASVNISIIDDAPVLRSTTMSILENSGLNEIVGIVNIASHGKSRIISFELGGASAGSFEIDTKGYIRVASGAVLDYETKPKYELTLKATNAYDTSNQVIVKINLINISDGEPVLFHNTISVKEDAKSGISLGIINVKDSGVNPIESFSISGDGSNIFKIDKNGVLRVVGDNLLDYETKKVYNLAMSATNGYGISNIANLTVKIEDVPETPPTVQALHTNIDENSIEGVVVDTININDNGNEVTSVILSEEGNSNFKVNNEGVITLNTGAVLDYETKRKYALKVVAKNAYGSSLSNNVTIDINNLPEPPTIKPISLRVKENSPIGRQIGTLSITSDGNIESISLSGDGNEDFSVDLNGTISVAKALNYSTKSNYALQAVATNAYGSSESVSVSIKPVLNKPFLLGSYNTPGVAGGVTLSKDGTVAFVADWNSGLQIIDVSNPSSPSLLGSYDTPDTALSVTLSKDGTVAFVADYGSGLQIIDVSNPSSPLLLGSYNTSGHAGGVTLSKDGTVAFVADGYSGLQIINVSNPRSPSLLGSYNTPGYAYDVTISKDGTIAFVGDSYSGLQIIDVSNPSSPLLLGSYDTPGLAREVSLSKDGTVAFVTDYNSGLQIIDVSNPSSPLLLGSYDTPGAALSVTLSKDGTVAFVADYGSGLQIIDVSNPTAPSLLGSYDTPGYAIGVTLSKDGTVAFVADENSGLQIIDVSFSIK